jgi:hypothetical protein
MDNINHRMNKRICSLPQISELSICTTSLCYKHNSLAIFNGTQYQHLFAFPEERRVKGGLKWICYASTFTVLPKKEKESTA